jgi:DNA-binding PadR family transcriptional regulator
MRHHQYQRPPWQEEARDSRDCRESRGCHEGRQHGHRFDERFEERRDHRLEDPRGQRSREPSYGFGGRFGQRLEHPYDSRSGHPLHERLAEHLRESFSRHGFHHARGHGHGHSHGHNHDDRSFAHHLHALWHAIGRGEGRSRGGRGGWGGSPGGLGGFGGGFGGGGPGGFGGDFGDGMPRGRKFSSDDLQLLLLALLDQEPSHGYELIKALEARSNGFYSPSPGMVYPALTYLEELGYVTVELEGNRKRYALSDAGREHLNANRERAELMLAKLTHIARKMDMVRRALSGEEPADQPEGDWLPELVKARHALKHALMRRTDAAADEQRRIAAILARATAEIEGREPQQEAGNE